MDEKPLKNKNRQPGENMDVVNETDVHDLYEPSREAYDQTYGQTKNKNVRR